MRRIAGRAVWWLAATAACTPLGLWVYDDPEFEVSRVRLASDARRDSVVEVALALWNPNDYDISTARFELHLQLDDDTIGRYERDSIIPLEQVETTTLSLPFTPTAEATPGRLAAFRSGTHRFLVSGRAVFTTPFGERRLRVADGGAMSFGHPAAALETGPRAPLPSTGVWPNLEPGPLGP